MNIGRKAAKAKYNSDGMKKGRTASLKAVKRSTKKVERRAEKE